MTRNEKIRKATMEFVSAMCQYCSVKEKCKDTKGYCTEYDSQECGFVAGAEWADTYPNLESLWRDASEEPLLEEKQIIFLNKHGIAYITERYGCTFSYMLEDSYWEKFVNILRISKWAYIDDLLPKGGEK